MMENSGADNLVEASPKYSHSIDARLIDLKIG